MRVVTLFNDNPHSFYKSDNIRPPILRTHTHTHTHAHTRTHTHSHPHTHTHTHTHTQRRPSPRRPSPLSPSLWSPLSVNRSAVALSVLSMSPFQGMHSRTRTLTHTPHTHTHTLSHAYPHALRGDSFHVFRQTHAYSDTDQVEFPVLKGIIINSVQVDLAFSGNCLLMSCPYTHKPVRP